MEGRKVLVTPFFGKLKEGEELLFLKRWSDLATFFSFLKMGRQSAHVYVLQECKMLRSSGEIFEGCSRKKNLSRYKKWIFECITVLRSRPSISQKKEWKKKRLGIHHIANLFQTLLLFPPTKKETFPVEKNNNSSCLFRSRELANCPAAREEALFFPSAVKLHLPVSRLFICGVSPQIY